MKGKERKDVRFLTIVLFISSLVLPFIFPGIEGVKRWITIGPLGIYIASVILPFVIIILGRFATNNRKYETNGLIIYALIILLFQPDAGQLTAFACAMVFTLWKAIKSWLMKITSVIVIVCIVVLSWVFLDDLAPVAYVEEILFLVADLGMILFVIGVISLLLLLFPFFFYGRNHFISLSLGIYFLVSILVTFFGNFPMPVMGYGVSPIIGYIIAITWLKTNQICVK